MSRACYRNGENACKILVRNPEGKRLLGRPRYKWEDKTGRGAMDWNHLSQDRDQWRGLVKKIMNFRVP
jgi:hypothetical protein